MDDIVIKPNKIRVTIILSILILVMVACSATAIVISDSLGVKIVGAFGIVFFGIGGLAALINIVFREYSMIISREGIIMPVPFSRGFSVVRWEDVEEIGIAKIKRQKFVGIRLSTYEKFLSDNPIVEKRAPILLALIQAARLSGETRIFGPFKDVREVAESIHDRTESSEALKPWKSAKGAAGVMRGNRVACGYDLAIAWSELDRSVSKMVALLNERLQNAHTLGG